MNTEQIIKALECCANKAEGCLCSDCPFVRSRYCTNRLRENALALIKEQQAEITKLTIALEAMRGAGNSYKMLYENLEKTTNYLRDRLKEEAEHAKEFAITDTVKKMQERLHEEAWQGYQVGMYIVSTDNIDQIAKEMLEGQYEQT